MVKASMDVRAKAVFLYNEGVKSVKEICVMYDTSLRGLSEDGGGLMLSVGLRGLSPRNLVRGSQLMLSWRGFHSVSSG